MTLLMWLILFVLLTIGLSFAISQTDNDGVIALGMLSAVVTLILLFVTVASTIDRHVTRNKCADYGAASGYEVQFIQYNSVSFECLVRTNDGWIPRDQIRGVEDL